MPTKTTTLLTTTILSLLFYGLSTSSALANSSNAQSQKLPHTQSDTRVAIFQEVEFKQTQGSQAQRTQVQDQGVQTQTPQAQGFQPNNIVGILKSFGGNSLEMRLADGTSQSFKVNPSVLNSLNLRPGSFVVLDTDENKLVQGVRQADVEKSVTGKITSIVDDQVTLELPNGETQTTIIAPATAARMRLAPGVPLMVTTYRGISATKVCLGKIAPPPISLPPVIPPPIGGGDVPPVGGGEPPPALW